MRRRICRHKLKCLQILRSFGKKIQTGNSYFSISLFKYLLTYSFISDSLNTPLYNLAYTILPINEFCIEGVAESR